MSTALKLYPEIGKCIEKLFLYRAYSELDRLIPSMSTCVLKTLPVDGQASFAPTNPYKHVAHVVPAKVKQNWKT